MNEIRVSVHHNRALQLANAMQLCRDDIGAYAAAVGLLAIHSAISFGDAVLIRLTGQRSRSKDHRKTLDAINKACTKNNIRPDGVKHLEKLVSAKTEISYGDKQADERTVQVLYIAAGRFQAWAEHVLKNKGRGV